MSFVLEALFEAVAQAIGHLILELVLKPFHWLAWATGVALCLALSLGRFQVEPFGDDGEWVPEEGRPILYAFGATTAGIGAWILLLAAIFRPYIL